jgi:hypothetical protein
MLTKVLSRGRGARHEKFTTARSAVIACALIVVVAVCGGCDSQSSSDGSRDGNQFDVANLPPPPPAAPPPPVAPAMTLAQCMTANGWVLYGANWCPYTLKQIADFGKDFRNLKYVECTKKPGVCTAAGIAGYPTWTHGASRIAGYKTRTQLASLSSCD